MVAAPAGFPQISVQRGLSERVAELLAERIVSRELLPGARLESESELARQLGVSRTVVREAVSRLKSDGLLESRQGIGVFVCEVALRPLRIDPLSSSEDVLHIVALRCGIESEAAGLAATHRTPTQLKTIQRALTDIDAAVAKGRDGVDEDVRFHRRIAEASGNPYILSVQVFLEQYFRNGTRVTRANEARRADFTRQVLDEHRAIVDAIAAKDAAAARRAAARHMQNAAKRIGLTLHGESISPALRVVRNGRPRP